MGEAILSVLQQYINAEFLGDAKRSVDPNEPIISSGLVDSFHLVDLVVFVEDSFGVLIADTELDGNAFDTLSQLAALIESRR